MGNGETGSRRESGQRLAAIMFTDMVGYSSLTQRDEARALEVLEVQARLMEPILVLHGGRLIRTMGDGTFVEFSSAAAACKAAVEIQSAISNHNESGPAFQVRIGIHLGDVESVNGDLFGHGVNVAARIEPLAEPGGICVSEDVARQVSGRIDAKLVSIGRHALKGIEGDVHVFSLSKASLAPAVAPCAKPRNLPSVAVLPFANVSPDPENEFFGDGLAEEILWSLSKVRTLAVVSRTSCFALKGSTQSIGEIGKSLGVDHVLEGSIRRSGNRVRIAVQLVDIARDRPVYSDKFDRELEDIFAIQEEITQSVVDALQVAISEAEKGAISTIPTKNLKAYEAYVRAVSLAWIMPLQGNPHFEEAMRLDPTFAKAFAAYATNCLVVLRFQAGSDLSYVEKARAAASRAIELDPGLAEAHVAAAEVAFQEGNAELAVAKYEAALAIDPQNYEAHYGFARMHIVLGNNESAVTHFLRSAEVRPDEYQPLALAATKLSELGRTDEAVAAGREGIARVERRVRCCPDEARAYILGGLMHLKAGDPGRGEEFVLKALELEPSAGTLYNTACFYSLKGDKEKAIETLERSYESGINFAAWLRHDSDLKPIIDDPRVQEVINKMEARMRDPGSDSR